MAFPRLPVLAALLFAALAPATAQQPAGTPPVLPNLKLTPGDTLDVTLADIQEHGDRGKNCNKAAARRESTYCLPQIPGNSFACRCADDRCQSS